MGKAVGANVVGLDFAVGAKGRKPDVGSAATRIGEISPPVPSSVKPGPWDIMTEENGEPLMRSILNARHMPSLAMTLAGLRF